MKNEHIYIYHNSSKNFWISINFKRFVSNSEIVQVTCIFQLHDKDNFFRVSSKPAEVMNFDFRPNNEKVYERAKIELGRTLRR